LTVIPQTISLSKLFSSKMTNFDDSSKVNHLSLLQCLATTPNTNSFFKKVFIILFLNVSSLLQIKTVEHLLNETAENTEDRDGQCLK